MPRFVKGYRKSWFVIVMFCLISMGQAYPYAVAYGMTPALHQCSCHRAGRPCIHGCDIRMHRAMRGHHRHSAHHVQDNTVLAAKNPSQKVPLIFSTCSRQNQSEIFGFQGEPFLIAPFTRFVENSFHQKLIADEFSAQGIRLACEDPPPKEDNPPENPS